MVSVGLEVDEDEVFTVTTPLKVCPGTLKNCNRAGLIEMLSGIGLVVRLPVTGVVPPLSSMKLHGAGQFGGAVEEEAVAVKGIPVTPLGSALTLRLVVWLGGVVVVPPIT